MSRYFHTFPKTYKRKPDYWSLLDFYRAYQNNGVQLAFSF